MEILALLFNFIGTIILAVSTGKFFKWVKLAFGAHEMTLQTLLHPESDVLNISGTSKHLADTLKRSTYWMLLGVILIVIGFGVQLYVAIINK